MRREVYNELQCDVTSPQFHMHGANEHMCECREAVGDLKMAP